uniref:hypothetical protein n=1 Tax=Brevundimonas sp. TaxID=1871086 RepID=UPI0026377CD3
MLDKALEQVDSAAQTRQQAVRARGRYQTLLVLLSAAFATLALPIGYAATLPDATPELLPIWAWDQVIFLPALANAMVMISSVRLMGRLDRKLAASLNRV